MTFKADLTLSPLALSCPNQGPCPVEQTLCSPLSTHKILAFLTFCYVSEMTAAFSIHLLFQNPLALIWKDQSLLIR